MIQRVFYLLFFAFVFLFNTSFEVNSEKIIPDFTLKNVDGNMLSTADYSDAKGFIVIFTCNHCPFAKLYSKRMNDMHTKFSKQNVPLLAINSMDTLVYEDESYKMMQQKAKQEKFNFPYLYDPSQQVGKAFGADHTPMAYVIWKENNQWVIKYKGAIDDNGEHPKLAKPFIDNALKELLSNQKVILPETTSFGCRIFYRKN
jgi:peroxiredoxin